MPHPSSQTAMIPREHSAVHSRQSTVDSLSTSTVDRRLWTVDYLLVVLHRDQKKPRRRHGRAGRAAIARREHLVDPLDAPPAATDLHERADDGAHHVTEETVGRDVVTDQLSTTEDTGDTEVKSCTRKRFFLRVLSVPRGGEVRHAR